MPNERILNNLATRIGRNLGTVDFYAGHKEMHKLIKQAILAPTALFFFARTGGMSSNIDFVEGAKKAIHLLSAQNEEPAQHYVEATPDTVTIIINGCQPVTLRPDQIPNNISPAQIVKSIMKNGGLI